MVQENLAWNASVLPIGGPFPLVPTNPGVGFPKPSSIPIKLRDTSCALFVSPYRRIDGAPPAKGEPIKFQTCSV